MSTMEELLQQAHQQLEEHKSWLREAISALRPDVDMAGAHALLLSQVDEVKVRTVRPQVGTVSVVCSYPDELHAFLTKMLPSALAGGMTVSDDVPAFTAKRES